MNECQLLELLASWSLCTGPAMMAPRAVRRSQESWCVAGSDCVHHAVQETEKRLKDIVHGNKKSVGGGNGLARKQLQMRNGSKTVIMVRCSAPLLL